MRKHQRRIDSCLRQAVAMFVVLATTLPGQEPPPAQAPQQPQQPQTQPMPVPRLVAAHRGAEQIVIDGALRDWPRASPLFLDDTRQLSGTAMGAWRGPDDLRGRAFLVWDDEAVYFAAVVQDDWHRVLSEDSPREFEIPSADSVMLSFDPRRDTVAIGPDEGREEDREFWFAVVEGQGRKVVLWDRLRGTARYAVGAEVEIHRDDDRFVTTYEARIPWKEVLPAEISPTPGAVLDVQVVLNDYDEITDLMPQTRVGWTFGSAVRIDPAIYGSVMLVKQLGEQLDDLPPFPPTPDVVSEGVPDVGYWVALSKRLASAPPVAVTRDSDAPEFVLGETRLLALQELDEHLGKFPRVDFLQYQQRVHRRMRRECGGIVATGLPAYWQYRLEQLGRELVADPKSGFRIFRLPVGGWVVRSNEIVFAIDPAGYNLEKFIGPALDLALLTQPTDLTKRNDQVLLRLAAAKRPFYSHRLFHLPGIDGARLPLVTAGSEYARHGVKFRVIGKQEGVMVSPTVGYVVEWPDGTTLMHSGWSMMPEDLKTALPEDRQVDLLILSAKHPAPIELTKAVNARLVVLDDVLQCSTQSGSAGRVPLEDVFQLQSALRPRSSVIVAPGESLDVSR